MTQFDIPEVWESYETGAHELIQVDAGAPRVAVIYFSSNGLYFPNDLETFRTRILEGNRFDWYKNRVQEPAIHIFVRDVLKTWYLAGPSRRHPSVEALRDHLKELSQGLPIVTVGSSAGGYAALLYGCLLNAERIYAFSPQTYLPQFLADEDGRRKNRLLVQYQSEGRNQQYFDLRPLLQAHQGAVYFFYPGNHAIDTDQADRVRDLLQVRIFAFTSADHGATMHGDEIGLTINVSQTRLDRISRKGAGKKFTPQAYSRALRGLLPWTLGRLSRLASSVVRRLKTAVNR